MTPIYVIDELKDSVDWGFVLEKRTVWVRSLEIRLSLACDSNHWGIRILDLKEAYHRGKQCEEHVLTASLYCKSYQNPVKEFLSRLDWCLVQLMECFRSGSFSVDADDLVYRTTEHDSCSTFSPFHLNRLPRLKKIPSKWTKRDAIRAIANGQYSMLRCDGRYTDDYYEDDRQNYRRGDITNWLGMVEKILTGDGWRVYADEEERVHICCHHFDYNSMKLNLDGTRE